MARSSTHRTHPGTDIYPAAKRSALMRGVRREGTAPEEAVRRLLDVLRVPYVANDRSLPGAPDLVMRGRKKVLFVHGCFWHHHQGCARASIPRTRRAWWEAKLLLNRRRDRRVIASLREAGWSVGVVWQCQTRKPSLPSRIRRFLTQRTLNKRSTGT